MKKQVELKNSLLVMQPAGEYKVYALQHKHRLKYLT